jgi:regulator of sigma E protease
MDFWIKAAQLLLSLSLLVILHELGHFIPARLFKTKVEKFYLFFNWPFALLRANRKDGKWKISWFSNSKGDPKEVQDEDSTEWGVGLLPLGGYVKIAGMVDESMDTEQLEQPVQPWEFRSKPAWQRLIIMIGGVTVNLLLGIVIYIGLMYAYGEEQLKPADLKAGLSIHPYMSKYGLHSGDNVLAINGEPVNNVSEINTIVMLRDGRALTVLHENGKKELVQLPERIEYDLFREGAMTAFTLRHNSLTVDTVIAGKAAEKAGLLKGDKVLSIEGNKVNYYDDIQRYFYASKNKTANFEVLRKEDTLSLKAKVSPEGTIGFAVKVNEFVDEDAVHQNYYGFGESIGKGIRRGMNTLGDYTAQLKFLFTKKGASSIGGFGSIGNMFPAQWNWEQFWMTTALLSIILAFMNILPIPALDGGHVVFLLYEMITGKQAPQKILEYAQYVGFILLMSLVIYANGNDLIRWLFP